jgi:hypothetical protein
MLKTEALLLGEMVAGRNWWYSITCIVKICIHIEEVVSRRSRIHFRSSGSVKLILSHSFLVDLDRVERELISESYRRPFVSAVSAVLRTKT